jgi:hypothetical protein
VLSRDELRRLAHAVLRDELGASAVGRLCPRCGSGEHGRPYVVVPGGRAPHVSLSYAEELVAVAWSDDPVGIDIEDDGPSVDGVDRRTWSRHEALFKADAEVRTEAIDVPDGYVATVAGTGVSWRLAGPAAPRP